MRVVASPSILAPSQIPVGRLFSVRSEPARVVIGVIHLITFLLVTRHLSKLVFPIFSRKWYVQRSAAAAEFREADDPSRLIICPLTGFS
jgi:hypothetical protein